MNMKDSKVGEILKTLAIIYGILSELGALIIAIVLGNETHTSYYTGSEYTTFEFTTFISIFLSLTLMVMLTTALLYAAGVLIENVVMIREKIVGTDAELGRDKPSVKVGYNWNTNSTANTKPASNTVNVDSDKPVVEKSSAEQTLDILKGLK